MARNWLDKNMEIFDVAMEYFERNTLKKELSKVLNDVAQRVLHIIESVNAVDSNTYPIYSGNMGDSRGVGVYIDGQLTSFMPTKKAIRKQHYGSTRNIVGAECLHEALELAKTQFSKGMWIVLFEAVPYSYKVNTTGSPWGRGVGHFDNLADKLFEEVQASLHLINPSINPL